MRRFRPFFSMVGLVLSACGPAPAEPLGQAAGGRELSVVADEPAPPNPPMPLPWQRSESDASRYCIVTHHTANKHGFAELAIDNQATYARRHGYAHRSFIGHISGAQFLDPSRGDESELRGGGLYWQKLTAMAQALDQGLEDERGVLRPCDWAVWMDSDVVITNPTLRLGDVVATYAPPPAAPELTSVDVLLVPDDRHPVSGGVFLVRNTAIGRGFISAVSALYPAYKDNSLPEQSAMATVAYMAEPWPSSHKVTYPTLNLHPSVAVLPQRAINAFPDLNRNQGEHVTWQPCDFVAHMAGVRHRDRAQVMRAVLATAAGCE